MSTNMLTNILTPSFLKLDSTLKRFNVFNATDMKRREIKHTKFLAHILDPNEPHGLGSKFLDLFIHHLNTRETDTIDILGLDLSNATIEAEYQLTTNGTIDLLIFIPKLFEESKNTIIAIEVKVDAKESINQLQKYRESIENEFGNNYEIFYFYLTQNNDEPSDPEWTAISFVENIATPLKHLSNGSHETISTYILSILDDYIDIIDESNPRLIESESLAQKIPQDHIDIIKSLPKDPPIKSRERFLINKYKTAFEFLANYDEDPRKNLAPKFFAILESDKRKIFRYESSTRQYLRASFLDENTTKLIQKISLGSEIKWVSSKNNLALEFYVKKPINKSKFMDISLKLVLGPTNPEFTARTQLVHFIRGGLPNLIGINNKKSVTPSFTTILSAKELNNFSAEGLTEDEILHFIAKSIQDEKLVILCNQINKLLSNFFARESTTDSTHHLSP